MSRIVWRVGLLLSLCVWVAFAFLVAGVLTGCASAPPREPIIRTVEVKVPVVAPCKPDLGAAPAYPDTPAALKGAADLFARVQLLLAGRALRIAREGALSGALKACEGDH